MKSNSLSAFLILSVLTLCVLALAGMRGWQHHTQSPRYRLDHGTPEERRWAIRELMKGSPSVRDWEKITASLQNPDSEVQLAAIAAVSSREGEGATPLLLPMTGKGYALIVRLRALEAMGKIGGPTAWEHVRKAMSAPEPEMRALAARSVGRYSRRDAMGELVSLLQDPSETVRLAASEAMSDLAVVPKQSVKSWALSKDTPVVWEAERGVRIRQNFEIAPSCRELARLPELVKTDPLTAGVEGFSGDGWLQCLEGGGGNHEWLGGESGSIDIGRAAYPIMVPRDGKYRLWARMWLMDKCGDSYNGWFDHMPSRLVDHPWVNVLGEWRLWFWLIDQNGPVELSAGMHTLYIQVREDGIRIDQFCLVPEGGPAPAKGAALQANLDPLSLAQDDVEVTLSRESEVVDSKGRLQATARVMRCGGAEAEGVLELDAEDGSFDCPKQLPVSLRGNDRVFIKDITVKFDPASAGRERVLSAKFVPAHSARIQTSLDPSGERRGESRLLITKPLSWLLAGPFAVPQDVDTILKSPPAKWQTFEPERLFNRYGTMDFEKVFGNGACGRVFLKTRIRCEKAGSYLWLLNSDDNSTVWLDGRPVIANPRSSPAEGFLTRANIEISEGEHVIVAAVLQGDFPDGNIYNDTQNYWMFRLRIRKEEHVPAPIVGLPWKDPSPELERTPIQQSF